MHHIRSDLVLKLQKHCKILCRVVPRSVPTVLCTKLFNREPEYSKVLIQNGIGRRLKIDFQIAMNFALLCKGPFILWGLWGLLGASPPILTR
uniref:Uncharacterized protein n=1 Tax=viral metagenome TaxID=1070528 RepID=A0A6C0BKN7_9ZZZZ